MCRYRAKFKRHAKLDIRIQNIKTERAHRVGIKKRSPCRSIVAKLSSFKIKECILTEAKNLWRFFESYSWNKEKELGKGKRAKSPK